MIKVIQYSIGKGKGRDWEVVFKGDNKPLKRYERLCLGFKDENGKWVVFEVKNKTTKINGMIKEYIYEASFLGYSPDTTIELDKVDFEWITDKEVISEAGKQACYT